ncbi:MAG: glycosyl hydrolase family 18 protein [Firmicutes bacterium]|jgi:spore germination protein YaaH|nr:glycosyl hydrolase family 18 protein [Bacillota bacterium]
MKYFNRYKYLILPIVIIIAVITVYIYSRPSIYDKDKTIYLGDSGIKIEYDIMNQDYYPLEELSKYFYVNYEMDRKYKVVTISKGNNLVRYNYGKDVFYVNNEKEEDFDKELVKIQGDDVLASKEFIENYLYIDVEIKGNNTVLTSRDIDYKLYKSGSRRNINSELNIKLGKLKKNQKYFLIEEGLTRNLIITDNLQYGYVEKNENDNEIDYKPIESFRVDKLQGEKIVLAWEQVFKGNVDTNKIGSLGAVNVISPTWLSVINKSGDISSRIDYDYLKWAKKRGYHVWLLIDNSFDPDITNGFLNDLLARENIIRQLEEILKISNIDGINLDFENVYLKDKDKLVQFVGELLPIVHKYNKTLSIDVTVMGGSDNWSNFLDRKRLGQIVDFMAVMTYDEHWASSPNSGSVASLPWVEEGMERISKIVDKDKLIMGIPLYSRIWHEKAEFRGKAVKQNTKSMNYILKLVKEKNLEKEWLEDLSQNYVEYKEDGLVKRIWLEDLDSIEKKVELLNNNGYRGLGAWKRGLESPGVWKKIEDTLK